MTSDATAHLARAREDLDEARTIAALPLARLAARSASFAAFQAAEASRFVDCVAALLAAP